MSRLDDDLFLCFFSDYVFFENSSSNPYLIRRIEELNKVKKNTCVYVCLCAVLPRCPRPQGK